MAGWQPALVAVVLLAVTLSGPTAASGKSDIVGAVTKQSAKMRGASKIAIGGGKSAEPRAGGSTLGVKGPQKQHHYSKKCGTQTPSHKEMEAVQPFLNAAAKFSDDEDAARNGSGDETRLLANEFGSEKKTVNVYWHVLKEGGAYSQGNIPMDAINKQIDVLNDRFSPSHIQFNLAEVDYTENSAWFRVQQGSDTEQDMKKALHKGGMQDLNVYSARPLGTDGEFIAGSTKLPMYSKNDPEQDGCTILFDSLPGGSQYGLDLGMTLVHETGHWLGLVHVFDGGCDVASGGDGIGDTWYSKEASFDCKPKNTCPHIYGQDPIHNPMNYSPDQCMRKFTKKQYKRMRENWYAFRSQTFSN